MAEPLDLEALKRQAQWARDNVAICHLTPGTVFALVAVLERIPELERDLESARSAYRAEEARLRGVHRQALSERDDEIERLEGRVRDKDFELSGVHEALRKATRDRDAMQRRAEAAESDWQAAVAALASEATDAGH